MGAPQDSHAYDDIIDLPRPVSPKHPRMPLHDRAAQFSPFAALSGYEEAVGEAGRLTGRRIELGEDAKAALNAQLARLLRPSAERSQIAVTWFLPDTAKTGGEYVTTTGTLRRLDETIQSILLMDGRQIPVEDILQIEEL